MLKPVLHNALFKYMCVFINITNKNYRGSQEGNSPKLNIAYSTVTDLAKLRGKSTSIPLLTANQ